MHLKKQEKELEGSPDDYMSNGEDNYISQKKFDSLTSQYYIKDGPKGKSSASHKPKPDPQANQFYKNAIKPVRHSGNRHITFLEGIWNPDNLEKPSYYKDTAHNLVYKYHSYPIEANDSAKQSFDRGFKKFKKKTITFLAIWVNSI